MNTERLIPGDAIPRHKSNCQFVKLATGLYEIMIDGEIQWGAGQPRQRRTRKISLEGDKLFQVAYCRTEHRSPVTRLYQHIPASQLRFVVQSLTGPKNNCEIICIEER